MKLAVVLGTLAAACGPGDRNGTTDPDAAVPVDTSLPTADSPPAVDQSQIYAHSGTTLYKVNAMTFQATTVGPMTDLGAESLTDLAIDKNNKMVGITLDKLYAIDTATAKVTLIKDLSASAKGFTSLSYIPTDLNDVNSADILVAANGMGDVYKIDPSTGDATKIGSYGSSNGKKVVSSGDLIGVRGLGIYATVDVGTDTNDYLARIDPITYLAAPIGTGTGFDAIFGLAFWGGTIYGFDKAGDIITIDPTTGKGTKKGGGQGVQWFGAGVTTDAPIIF